ncbi:MAG TPA: amidohydrolase family protein [Gemmataceae bacterium]|jgi:cytosine/adenosine deaminase-related metal-dependent hydrolase|nr:amidohydrolase family protein [Gemmataceae bacterium]
MAGPVDEQVLSARWVFPVTGPPLANGTVSVRGDRIVAVEPAGSRTPDTAFGNAAIIPGLVNAHTHFDLSGARGAVPPDPDFVGWLRRVIAHRRTQSPTQSADAIRAGLNEAQASGTTLVGDIAAAGASWDTLVDAPIWAVCFRELLGLPGTRVMPAWVELIQWIGDHPDTATCRAGVSPHAPYSVHRALIEATARLWPVCIHLAETREEEDLLNNHDGPFVPFLRELGVWDRTGLAPSWDWITWKMSRAPTPMFVHGNYLDPAMLFPPNGTVVICPRTHRAFGHGPHPFREFLRRGIRVAIGTDSLASNPDLDVLAEVRCLHAQYPDVPGDQLMRMATLNGAAALGFDRSTGSLESGKSADLVVVPLPNRDELNAYTLLLDDANTGPRKSMWRGQWR